MPKMIQIRNVPNELHREMKVRAAKAGMSLSEYLLDELRHIAEKPSVEEWMAQLAKRKPVEISVSAADIIRELRGPIDSR